MHYKYLYKGKRYAIKEECWVKTGFWFWRKWRNGIIYISQETQLVYVRTANDFFSKFRLKP